MLITVHLVKQSSSLGPQSCNELQRRITVKILAAISLC